MTAARSPAPIDASYETALLDRALLAAQAGLTPAAVTTSYLGGSSEHWRRFLVTLAEHAEQWVPWPTLHAAVGRSDRQCRDIVHRAERRSAGWPPYIRAIRSPQLEVSTEYWMPADAAGRILLLAIERPPRRAEHAPPWTR